MARAPDVVVVVPPAGLKAVVLDEAPPVGFKFRVKGAVVAVLVVGGLLPLLPFGLTLELVFNINGALGLNAG